MTTLHHISVGAGAPVVLVHGMAASWHDWEWLLPDLSAAGYRGLALDLLGHGDSPKPAEARRYHAETLYQTFAGWLDAQDFETPVVLIGHSLGGYLSLIQAMRRPETVAGLVLINPFYTPQQLAPIFRFLRRQPSLGASALRLTPLWLVQAAAAIDPLGAPYLPRQTRYQIALDYKRASPHIMHIAATLSDLTPCLSQVQPPTRVIWGDRDLTLNPRSFPRLVPALPNAAGQSIRGCGHQPHIVHAGTVNRIILEFLAELQC